MPEVDDDAPLSPEASLALIVEEQHAAARRLAVSVLGGGGMLATALLWRVRRHGSIGTLLQVAR